MRIKVLALTLVLVMVFAGAAMAQFTAGYTGVFTNPLEFDDTAYFAAGGDYENYGMHADDDGTVFYNDVDRRDPGDYTHLEDLDRTGYSFDRNRGNQTVSIRIDTQAYIPCFLEMKIQGNQGTTSAISYGPNADADTTASGYLIAFDNEIGGFLDENWVSLGHGSNAQINPGDLTVAGEEVYIGACDIFSVEVISNDDYKYSVEAQALVAQDNSGSVLPMHMRTSLDAGATWESGYDTFTTSSLVEVNKYTGEPGEKLTALHNFRVPFTMDTDHGYYNGEVIFRAATI